MPSGKVAYEDKTIEEGDEEWLETVPSRSALTPSRATSNQEIV